MKLEDLKNIKIHFQSHLSLEDEHITTYVSEDGKLGFSDHVPFKNGQPHGHSYRHWRIEGKVFKKREKFIAALKDFNP